MSDDFIAFNQSTPNNSNWQKRNNAYQNRSYPQASHSGRYKKWGHNSRNNSFGNDRSGHCPQQRDNDLDINAYLHPSMLQDPWKHLRDRRK